MDTNLTVAYGPQIAAAATRHHLEPRLLAAVAAQETGGPGTDSGRNVVGDGGHGRGLFQIDDRWHSFARTPDAMDPGRNADYAAGLLESNLQHYGGDLRAALSAYNAGSPTAEGTRTDWGDGRPLSYADSVMRHYARLGESAADAGPGEGEALSATPGAGEPDALQQLVDALWGLACPPSAAPLNAPAYRPLPPTDTRDRDVAPAIALGDESFD